MLVAVGLYAINIALSVTYFVPELLKVERIGTEPDAASSRIWVRRNRWRGVIFIGITAALSLALARLTVIS